MTEPDQTETHDEQGGSLDFNFNLTYYLSGPMTGIADFNYPLFEFAAAALRQSGVKIISPIECEKHDPEIHDTEEKVWQWYMDRCQEECAKAHGIILLPGWAFSKGSRQELNWMHGDTGCPTYFFSPYKMVLTDMNFPKETIFNDGPPAATTPAGASDGEGTGG